MLNDLGYPGLWLDGACKFGVFVLGSYWYLWRWR